jgi:hypothetical protein
LSSIRLKIGKTAPRRHANRQQCYDRLFRAWEMLVRKILFLFALELAATCLIGNAEARGFARGFGGFYGGPRVGVFVGPRFGWYGPNCYPYAFPYYPYCAYPPPDYAYAPPPDGSGSVARGQSWYYCDDPKGYYPYVSRCSHGWQAVPAAPPPPPPPPPG